MPPVFLVALAPGWGSTAPFQLWGLSWEKVSGAEREGISQNTGQEEALPPAGGDRNKGAGGGGGQPAPTAGPSPAKPLGREALTQEALFIDNDGVILRGLGQTEELAPGWTDRQTQGIVSPSRPCGSRPPHPRPLSQRRDPVYPELCPRLLGGYLFLLPLPQF